MKDSIIFTVLCIYSLIINHNSVICRTCFKGKNKGRFSVSVTGKNTVLILIYDSFCTFYAALFDCKAQRSIALVIFKLRICTLNHKIEAQISIICGGSKMKDCITLFINSVNIVCKFKSASYFINFIVFKQFKNGIFILCFFCGRLVNRSRLTCRKNQA